MIVQAQEILDKDLIELFYKHNIRVISGGIHSYEILPPENRSDLCANTMDIDIVIKIRGKTC